MLSSINALSRLEWQPSCWFNWWLYILSNDTCQKALQTCPQLSLTAPNVLNIWWIVKPLTSTNLHDLSPLFTKTKPKPNIKNQTNLTFNLVFPPPLHIFSPKKICQRPVAIVAITHCKDTSFSPGLAQRFVATRTKCHLVASSSNVFYITCSLYLLMNRVCHVYG